MSNQQIFMEARRISPDSFYELSVKKYGVEGSQALTRDQIKDLATANGVLVPIYVAGQKTARGKYSTRPPGYIDQEPAKEPPKAVKTSPFDTAPKVMTPERIKKAAESFEFHLMSFPMGKSVWMRDPVEPSSRKPGAFTFALRSYGSWMRDDELEFDEDDDFMIPTPETIKQIQEAIRGSSYKHPDMKFSFSYSEKQWIYFTTEAK